MLKIIGLSNILGLEIKNGNNKIIKFNIDDNDEKLAKKLKKLFKSKKLTKFKKLSKSENLSKFNIKKIRPIFLILDTKIAFNYL